MVQVTPLLATVSVLAHFNPTMGPAGSDLVARQSSISTSNLPSACQSPCQVVNTLINCADNLSCVCSSSVGNSLEQCLDCLTGADPAVQNQAQADITAWNAECNGHLSLNPSKPNGGKSLGLTAGGVAICVVTVLAGASMCF